VAGIQERKTIVYEFYWLHTKLLLIMWLRTPPPNIATQFINRLHELLDESPHPVYIISDLRRGRIIDGKILAQLGQLTQHKNWAGSTAFSQNPISNMFANTFQKTLKDGQERNLIFDKPEDAISFLGSLDAEIVSEIDWQAVLTGNLKAGTGDA
jgi:hypothetical protein